MHQLRHVLLAVFTAGLLWSLPVHSHAENAVVHTHDGRRITGQLVSQDDTEVVLRVAGILTPIPRGDIERVEIQLSLEDEYRQRRGAIEDDDVDQRYRLALWLFEQRAYTLAKSELEDMARRFPDDGRIEHLQPLVEARLRLQREAQEQAATRPQAPSQPSAAPAATPDREADTRPRTPMQELLDRRLTDEQVNLIKVYEIELDTEPRVRIPRQVLQEVFERYAHNEEVPRGRAEQLRFLSAPGWQQLDLLFALRAREYYDQVQIAGDPQTVAEFRRLINRRYVLAYCGSNECHGGEDVGDFFVFNQRVNEERTVYSNYWILSDYQNARGYMIDRDQPERSLLLQYGLPRQEAYTPHPDVPGWRARLTHMQHPQFQTMLDWIAALPRPKPNVPLNYRPPGWRPPVEPVNRDDRSETQGGANTSSQ